MLPHLQKIQNANIYTAKDIFRSLCGKKNTQYTNKHTEKGLFHSLFRIRKSKNTNKHPEKDVFRSLFRIWKSKNTNRLAEKRAFRSLFRIKKTKNTNRLAEKDVFRSLHGKKKLQFLWDYYKLPAAAACIAAYIVLYSLYRHASQKDTVLYAALVNVSMGEDLTQHLTSGFLESLDIDHSKNICQLYSGLYLTDDETSAYHEYTYASRMKILAAIESRQLDVVLMDQNAFDAFSQNGYLHDLDHFFSAEDSLYEMLQPYFVENTAVLEDNALDLYFDESAVYHAQTETYCMGIDLSASPVIQQAGFCDTIYLGIVKNSPRSKAAAAFVQYLYES